MEKRVLIIGAGVGGLSTAALLARAGVDVTVLESHVYPGGCAGTFFHQKYRFDAGATLAGGFYPGGPMDLLSREAGVSDWGAYPAEPAMVVHLPNGQRIPRWTDERRHAEHLHAFGKSGAAFFEWQETTADALWDLALRTPAWPPQSVSQGFRLAKDGLAWLSGDARKRLRMGLVADAFSPLSRHLKSAPGELRDFIDGQLLISAQATSDQANALYGASALDLPRRGVVHLRGGMGAIATKLVQAIRLHGGRVIFRQQAVRIRFERNVPVAVETRRGDSYPADLVVANLPPWNIARLVGEETGAPGRLGNLSHSPRGWGAFVVYIGLDGSAIPDGFPLHHQVLKGRPLGEGNSLFLSLSPDWDQSRAPEGKRALTISTHTDLERWRIIAHDPDGYTALKQMYVDRLLANAEIVLPGLRMKSELILPGTPLTFERFTQREQGWVGGFPQVNLFQAWGPRLGKNLWMVGDSIFPGQSTAAVALGGIRVGREILATIG